MRLGPLAAPPGTDGPVTPPGPPVRVLVVDDDSAVAAVHRGHPESLTRNSGPCPADVPAPPQPTPTTSSSAQWAPLPRLRLWKPSVRVIVRSVVVHRSHPVCG